MHVAVLGVCVPFHLCGLYVFLNILEYGYDTIPAWTVATQGLSFLSINFYLYCCDITQSESLVRFSR